jgi:hypothetical protein
VNSYERLGKNCYLHLQDRKDTLNNWWFSPENIPRPIPFSFFPILVKKVFLYNYIAYAVNTELVRKQTEDDMVPLSFLAKLLSLSE